MEETLMNNIDELVTMETFVQQVWEIEGVKIELKPKNGAIKHLVRPYNYPRLPDDATVDDLKARLNECVNNPFIFFVNV